MHTYSVTIKATVTKTLVIEADTEDDAITTAHEEFDCVCVSPRENYDQETVSVEKED